MRYMKKGWRYITDNKVTNKLKSIAVNTYILTVFFWIVLTISMILLLLIAVDLHDVIEKLVMWNTTIMIVLTGVLILFFVLTTFKSIGERHPILWIYLLLMIILLAIPVGLVTVFESKIITIFVVVTYIINFFPAYYLAKEIVGNYKGFKELFTKRITKITYEEKEIITQNHEKDKKPIIKEVTTEENSIGIIIFSIVIPVVLSVIKLLVSN